MRNLFSVCSAPLLIHGTVVSPCWINVISICTILVFLICWILYDICVSIQWHPRVKKIWNSVFYYFKPWPSAQDILVEPPPQNANNDRIDTDNPSSTPPSSSNSSTLSSLTHYASQSPLAQLSSFKVCVLKTIMSLQIFLYLASTSLDLAVFFRSSSTSFTDGSNIKLRIIDNLVMCITWIYAFVSFWIHPPFKRRYPLVFLSIINLVTFALLVNAHLSPYKLNVCSFTTTFIPINLKLVLPIITLLHPSLSFILICIILSTPVRERVISSHVSAANDVPSSSKLTPEDGVSLYQWLTFNWASPLLRSGQYHPKGQLGPDDVWSISPFSSHSNLLHSFAHVKSNSGILMRLFKSQSMDLIIDITFRVVSSALAFLGPYFLKRILECIEIGTKEAKFEAYNLATFTLLTALFRAHLDCIKAWHGRRAYERTRGILIGLVHEKALRRKDISRVPSAHSSEQNQQDENAGVGKIIALMSNDAYAISQRFWDLGTFISTPIRLIISVFFLYNVIGWSCLLGLSTLIFTYGLQRWLGKKALEIANASLKVKDKRIAVVSELISSIRLLKSFAWERFWVKRAKDAREDELYWRLRDNVIACLMCALWSVTPDLVILFTFMSYTKLAHQNLTIPVAFTSLSLLRTAESSLTAIPGMILVLIRTMISVRRFESFLKEPDRPELGNREDIMPSIDSVGFETGNFTWPQKDNINQEGSSCPASAPVPSQEGFEQRNKKFNLHVPTFNFKMKSLNMITGPIGAGKSAMLLSLVGEMDCIDGKIIRPINPGATAYAAQTPWLEQATIKENIIFRSPFDQERFDRVIYACALNRDIDKLSSGVDTEIGERGISLSGGQKARLCLARAMYSRAPIVLLDDPLSAVDTHTARHLVENCLTGPLSRERTIILVTHHETLVGNKASFWVNINQDGNTEIKDLSIYSSSSSVKHQEHQEPSTTMAEFDMKTFIHSDESSTVINTSNDEGDTSTTNSTTKKVASSSSSYSDTPHRLVSEETREKGKVKWNVYKTYMQAAKWITWPILLILLILSKVGDQATTWFLKAWGESYSTADSLVFQQQQNHQPMTLESWQYPLNMTSTLAKSSRFIVNMPPASENVDPWLIGYFLISNAATSIVLIRMALVFWSSFQAARALFNQCLDKVSCAPIRFFDTNPVGRLMNRFTSDVNAVDGAINSSLGNVMNTSVTFLFSIGVLFFAAPPFIPFALFIIIGYYFLASPFITCSRDLRRLEYAYLSPVYSKFGQLLIGLSTVRAFSVESIFNKEFCKGLDVFQNFDHHYWSVNFWLVLRSDYLGAISIFFLTIIALYFNMSAGLAAFGIVNAQQFVSAVHSLCHEYAALELNLGSVERVEQLLNIDQEAPAVIEDKRPPAYWPSDKGGLHVEDLVVKYAPDLESALKGVTFSIKGNEKIGVVGRTGSGKSTIALSLLRIIEPTSGSIRLDDIDISTIGLHDLRSRVSYVPQEGILMSGTLQSNLDPLDEHTVPEIEFAKEKVGLESESLQMAISEEGSNVSSGKRQMISLARALLRNSQVIVLDEATSAVDFDTDIKIQDMLRHELNDKLVITIAHRVRTVIDYDRIMVINDGILVEMDTPINLLNNKEGYFRSICEASGDWEELSSILEKKHPPKK